MNTTPDATSTVRTLEEGLASVRNLVRSGIFALGNVARVVRNEIARQRRQDRVGKR